MLQRCLKYPLSGGCKAPNGGLDEVRGSSPKGSLPLTSFWPPFGGPIPPDNGGNKFVFVSM